MTSQMCDCDVNEINFLLDIKYEIMLQNSIIEKFLRLRKLHIQDMSIVNHDDKHSTILYEVMDNIVKNNKNSICNIEQELPSICKHRFVEDYVESGVDKPMIKIKYCDICEENFTELPPIKE